MQPLQKVWRGVLNPGLQAELANSHASPAGTSNTQDTRHGSPGNSWRGGGGGAMWSAPFKGSRTHQESLLLAKASHKLKSEKLCKTPEQSSRAHTHTRAHTEEPTLPNLLHLFLCAKKTKPRKKKQNQPKPKQSSNKTKISAPLPSESAFPSSPRLSRISREFGDGWEEPRVEGLYK